MNFILGIIISSITLVVLVLIPLVGVWALDLRTLFGVVIPYLALITFFVGLIVRVVGWARSPVPFRIPTTGGQQWSLPWVKHSRIDNPKNTALVFHYSFLVVVLRHLRFFTEPIPEFVKLIEHLDSFMQVGVAPFPGFMVPDVMISGFILLAAVSFLFLRRLLIPQVAYVSLPTDYFPLFLISAIAQSGILMRYLLKVDIVSVKELAMGLFTFHPKVPEGIGVLFYIHLFLVCVLIAYFPFSKLVHMAGIFLSPSRNLSNNSRFVRHVNPWNYPVPVHTYEEYEGEFRDKMIEAGLPVEKMPEGAEEQKAEAE
jgi:nitrate reductase gamma subunit